MAVVSSITIPETVSLSSLQFQVLHNTTTGCADVSLTVSTVDIYDELIMLQLFLCIVGNMSKMHPLSHMSRGQRLVMLALNKETSKTMHKGWTPEHSFNKPPKRKRPLEHSVDISPKRKRLPEHSLDNPTKYKRPPKDSVYKLPMPNPHQPVSVEFFSFIWPIWIKVLSCRAISLEKLYCQMTWVAYLYYYQIFNFTFCKKYLKIKIFINVFKFHCKLRV